MANTVFAEEIKTLTEELSEQDLEKLARGIENMKLSKFSSDTYRKGKFAGMLTGTDIVSVDLDFTRLTRPGEPFDKGTVHVIGATIPSYAYGSWSMHTFYYTSNYNKSFFKTKKQNVLPVLVIDNFEAAHLLSGDWIQIGDERFEVYANSAHRSPALNEECIWSKQGWVDYSQTEVKKVVDKWFEKLVEKHESIKAASTVN